jgi:hypothetical protein
VTSDQLRVGKEETGLDPDIVTWPGQETLLPCLRRSACANDDHKIASLRHLSKIKIDPPSPEKEGDWQAVPGVAHGFLSPSTVMSVATLCEQSHAIEHCAVAPQ